MTRAGLPRKRKKKNLTAEKFKEGFRGTDAELMRNGCRTDAKLMRNGETTDGELRNRRWRKTADAEADGSGCGWTGGEIQEIPRQVGFQVDFRSRR